MHQHEIVDLSWKLFDGQINDLELERFETLCLTDENAMRHFMDVAKLHIGLYEIFDPQRETLTLRHAASSASPARSWRMLPASVP